MLNGEQLGLLRVALWRSWNDESPHHLAVVHVGVARSADSGDQPHPLRVWSTPKSADNHAKQIRRHIRRNT
ncbi:hypothetical protein OAV07_01260 [Acidimicrobiales bacterium]|nr:hypothetical protein [Acidimicrobiales bacterium]MDC3300130.1 hypothetical protein [Acidimicrobiales bacterium]